MDTLISNYKYMMHEAADSRVQNWPMMNNPGPVLVILITYIYVVLRAGPRYMENRKPYDLKNVIQVYNVFQIIACTWLIYSIAINGWTTKYSVFRCEVVDYSEDPVAVRLAELVYWTFILKIIELIETVFFVLRKKFNQVSVLHLYHHMSTVTLAWLGVKYVAGGMATFCIMINSFIHILMYSYYFLSTFTKWQNSLRNWKPKLTLLQMIQFCIIIAHSTIALQESCHVPKYLAYLFIPNIFLIFHLFYKFYSDNYTKKKL